jgi:hypothetical protein
MLFKSLFAFIARVIQPPWGLRKSQRADAVLERLQPISPHCKRLSQKVDTAVDDGEVLLAETKPR